MCLFSYFSLCLNTLKNKSSVYIRFASLIYQFFKHRIESGYFRKGTVFPQSTCFAMYTMRLFKQCAMHISSCRKRATFKSVGGKNTVVSYDAPEEMCYHTLQDYYLAREESILCIKENLNLIIEPLLLDLFYELVLFQHYSAHHRTAGLSGISSMRRCCFACHFWKHRQLLSQRV